jgi:hypothetical protein
MLLKAETYKQQSQLAQFCRTGISNEELEVKHERLPHYRRLVFNVVKDALETSYPIAYKYLEKAIWDEMVYNFFCLHNCQHTQVWRMPKEFYEFCRNENYASAYNIPFLNDLLFFEWVEAEMYVMPDVEYPNFEKTTQLLSRIIVVNPEHQILQLEYPIHMLKPGEAVKQKGKYFLLLFREKESGKIQFISLSVLFTFLIENLVREEKKLEDILNDILLLFGINDLKLLQEQTFKFINELQKQGFVLGASI